MRETRKEISIYDLNKELCMKFFCRNDITIPSRKIIKYYKKCWSNVQKLRPYNCLISVQCVNLMCRSVDLTSPIKLIRWNNRLKLVDIH